MVVVQSNINDPAEGRKLTQQLHREIHEELGISCVIELVPRHTLPRTSSGKLSRAAAREDYLERRAQERRQRASTGAAPYDGGGFSAIRVSG